MKEEYKEIVTLNDRGIPVLVTHGDVKMPPDYSFESVNHFVNCENPNYEELQYLALGMSNEIENLQLQAAQAAQASQASQAQQQIKELEEAQSIAKKYCETNSQIDSGNLFYALNQCLEFIKSQAQQESQWMPIETAPKNKKIIVKYKNCNGNTRTVFAKYIEKFTEEPNFDAECETDYCENDDTYYLKEGWVELIDNWDEFTSVYFDARNVPSHWMLAPKGVE